MHFLGISGMPRRISDYPDAFAGLNYIASLGSMISVAASLVFFYLILNALLVQKGTNANTSWTSSQYRLAGVPATGVIAIFSAMLETGYKGDAATAGQLNFQTPATEIMEKIVDLHNDLFFFIVVVVLFVSWILGRMLHLYVSTNTTTPRVAFTHHTAIEMI